MSLIDTLFSRVSRPAGRALDPTIRDIVHAVLREHGYASPAEVQALRDEVRDMRGRVDGLQRRTDELVALAERARSDAVAEAEGRLGAMAEKLALLEKRLTERPSAPAVAPATPVATAPPAAVSPPIATVGCRVSGCDGTVRSKGFCSSHYQQWRRGTLREFVGPEGHVVIDGKNFQVSSSLAGGHAELRSGKLYVDGAPA